MLNKPEKLQKGDTIAIVSPSSGLAGEPNIQWRTQQGIENIKTLGLSLIHISEPTRPY